MHNDEKSDDELLKYMAYHKLSPALYIFDESYQFFTKKSDPVLVWFLAYHGHLGIDIIMIIHELGLIHSDYKAFTEFFIDAQPKSKSYRDNQLRYFFYASDKFDKANRYDSDSVISKKEIFDLYKSGDNHKPKKIIFKFILLGFVAFLFILFFVNLLISNMKDRNQVDDSSPPEKLNNSNENNYLKDGELIVIRCDDAYCWNTDVSFEYHQITKTLFKFLVVKYNLELQYTEVKNEIYRLIPLKKGMQKVTLASLTDFHYFIPKDLKSSYLRTLFIPRVIERDFRFEGTPNPIENIQVNEKDDKGSGDG